MLSKDAIWQELEKQAQQQNSVPDLLKTETNRLENFSVDLDGFYYDASKTRTSQRTLETLLAYAHSCGLEDWRNKMFSGEHINNTENRAVLHTALRAQNPRKEVTDSLAHIKKFVQQVHNEKCIKTIVNIGIGGSDLGPRMIYQALKSTHKKLDVHYVSNIDGHDLQAVLKQCKADETLFIIASKTFTTIETLTNAETAKEWLVNELGENAVKDHFVALSTNSQAAQSFGIDASNIFPFEDWVGGRFSLWSSIGLSLALGLGFEVFEELLQGAESMDKHFLNAPLENNIPVLMGVIGFWHCSFLNIHALACLPYHQRLEYLPLWLQQLDMESNGKEIDRNGDKVNYVTGPYIYGQPGTNGQHAFYQHIHQSPLVTFCEFIGIIKPDHPYQNQHEILLANLVGQSLALTNGQSASKAEPYKQFNGSRPHSILLLPSLSPFHLGQLLAAYEHKIFVQGILWNLNSFDQWGVELGKTLAKDVLSHKNNATDPATKELLKRLKL
jgi:glucose-6-phosphate isomerase